VRSARNGANPALSELRPASRGGLSLEG
jgi:hypothetical protein